MNIKEEFKKRIESDEDIGNFLPLLHDKVLDYSEPEILEFGTWKGSSTLAFLNAIKEVGGHLTSVDNRHYKIRETLKNNKNVTFIIQDSRTFESSKKYDIILVDTIHSYEQVKAECEVIKTLIKPGTLIFFHDTIFKFVITAAIDEFIERTDCIVTKHTEGKGMWEVEILK